MKRLFILLSFLGILSITAKSQVSIDNVYLKIDSSGFDTAFVRYTSYLGDAFLVGGGVTFRDLNTLCVNDWSDILFNGEIDTVATVVDTFFRVGYFGLVTDYFELETLWDTSGSFFPPTPKIIIDTRVIDNCSTVGISEQNQNQVDLSIYPNPSKDAITINSKQHISHFELKTIEGKKAIINPLGQNSFDISQNSSGVYLLRLVINAKSISKKVIISD